MGRAGWLALLVLTGFLIAAVIYAVVAWDALGGVPMSGLDWLFLVFGIVFTVAAGAGLMWLVFYPRHHDYDR